MIIRKKIKRLKNLKQSFIAFPIDIKEKLDKKI